MTSPAHGNIGWLTGGSLHGLPRSDAFDRRRAVPRRRDDGRMESPRGRMGGAGRGHAFVRGPRLYRMPSCRAAHTTGAQLTIVSRRLEPHPNERGTTIYATF